MSTSASPERVVLITGGGSGIGRSIAHTFADRGAGVFIVGRRESPLKETASHRPDRIAWLTADVTVPEDAARIVEATIERFGRLDVLVNNAADGVMRSLGDTDDRTLDRIVAVNLTGPLRLARRPSRRIPAERGEPSTSL